MNLVSWNSAIQITKKKKKKKQKKPSPHAHASATSNKALLWSEVASPADCSELVGNANAIRKVQEWFQKACDNPEASSCLFVHGESGTGKSTAVSLISRSRCFEPVTTFADQSRTPSRLEGVLREASMHGNRGVVVLDDFEIFLTETTSLRVLSKFFRRLLAQPQSSASRCLFVIISNSTHKFFGALQDISTIVHFERLQPSEMYTVFKRLSLRVKQHSFVPPMACYLSSGSSAGTISQGIQQLQLIYAGNTDLTAVGPGQKRKRGNNTGSNTGGNTGSGSSHAHAGDCISYLWCDIYTDKILENLLDERLARGYVLGRLAGFERNRLDIARRQLHDEYPRRATSIAQLQCVAESISASDATASGVNEGDLYDGENRFLSSVNDIAAVSFVASGVAAIKGLPGRKGEARSQGSRARLGKLPLVL